MLKTRIIPALLFKDRTIVKSVKFEDYRMIGDPTTVARVFNTRNADELIFLDITATVNNKAPNFPVIESIARECFMPLGIGGGITTIEHVDKLFEIGADKVILNTALVEEPELITNIAQKYGNQAVVASIDAKKEEEGYRAYVRNGKEKTPFTPIQLSKKAEALGAGEIYLNSIDKDGTMEGYDIELIKSVTTAVNIPVIVAGGCGKLQDFTDALIEGKADAVSAASIFHFIGESMITIKNHLHEQGISVRRI